MTTIFMATIAVFVISLISLIGAFALSLKMELVKKSVFVFIALAAGALLGDAFVHLIPESFEEASNPTFVSLAILAGLLSFFILEKFLRWHHSHGEVEYSSEHSHIHPVGPLVIISDGVHNFIDGMAIGVAFLLSPAVGIATAVAVVLHEIPQEIADFGMLIHAGYSRAKALLLNFASSLTAFVGLFVAWYLHESFEFLLPYLGAFAAGNFIYIALADIVPELHKEGARNRSIIQFVVLLIGAGLMFALLGVEAPGAH